MTAGYDASALVTIDPRIDSVFKLIREASETWLPYSADLLSAMDCEAFSQLVTRGFLLRRQLFEITCPGSPVVLQVSIDSTGTVSREDLQDCIEREVIMFDPPLGWLASLDELRGLKWKEQSVLGRLSSMGQEARHDMERGDQQKILYWSRILCGRIKSPIAPWVQVRNNDRHATKAEARESSEGGGTNVEVKVGVQTNVNAIDPDVPIALREIADALKDRSNQQADSENLASDPVAAEHDLAAQTGTKEAVVNYLASYHREDQDAKLALKVGGIAQGAHCSNPTVSRALKDVFGEHGHQAYAAACDKNIVAEKIWQYLGDGQSFGTAPNDKLGKFSK